MRATVNTFLRNHWDALLATLSTCIFIYCFTRHSGIGISPDSVTYYSAATNIRNHFDFSDFNGSPLVDFPVGYPAFLSIAMLLTGGTVLQLAPAINSLLLTGVILFTSYLINGSRENTPIYKLLFLALLACSPALLEVYSMLWSETLFIFLSLLFFISIRCYFRSHSYRALLGMAAVASLAFVTRYAGITFLFTGVALLFFDGELAIGKKIKHLLFFVTLGSSLAVINLLHNHRVSASLTGVREKALRSVTENIRQVGEAVADWLPFLKGHETAALIFFVLVLLVAIAVIFFHLLQQQYYHSYETIVTCFFVVYVLFLVTIASVSRFEDLSNRLLSPVYIPFLLVSTAWVVPVSRSLTRVKRNIFIALVLFMYAGWHYHQYQLNAEAWEGIKDAGIPGYTEDSWKESATIQYIKQHKADLPPILYSDAYDGVYFLTGVHSKPLPHKEIAKEIDALFQNPSFCVIWLNDGYNPDLISIDLIKQHKTLVSEKTLSDGAIYFFSDNTSVFH